MAKIGDTRVNDTDYDGDIVVEQFGHPMNIRTFLDWLMVRDYDTAKADAQRRVVARFSRGNVLVQLGRFITPGDASKIIRRGDRAMDRLQRASRR